MAAQLTAMPIYPETKTFPHVFLVIEEDDDFYTAYGLRVLDGPQLIDCDFCYDNGADAFIEHGATGAPAIGVPVHVRCVVSERGGIVAPTCDVELKPEEA